MIYTNKFGCELAGKIFQEIVWNGANKNKVLDLKNTVDTLTNTTGGSVNDEKLNDLNINIRCNIAQFLNQLATSGISEYFEIREDTIIIKKDFVNVKNVLDFKSALYKYIKYMNEGYVEFGIQTRLC